MAVLGDRLGKVLLFLCLAGLSLLASTPQAQLGLTATALAVVALDLQATLLWTCFLATVVAAILLLLGSVLIVVPVQFIPAPIADGVVATRTHVVGTGTVFLTLSWFSWFALFHPAWRTLLSILMFVVGGVLGALGIKLRAFIAGLVVRNILLPSTSMDPGKRLSTQGGGKITVADATMMMRWESLSPCCIRFVSTAGATGG